jgi:NAD(P)-dependent dehydrogenase (short-subunit alcohol dehydrogenase family)
MAATARTVFITGASSGLGLAVAQRLATEQQVRLILPVRNVQRAQELKTAIPAKSAAQALFPVMDLSKLESVRAGARALGLQMQGQRIDSVLFNAGVQSAAKPIFTSDGVEQSLAINHLAHHVLMRGLQPLLAERAIVGWTASGTHDPKDPVASKFSFKGAQYLSPQQLQRAQYSSAANKVQLNRDAYATSKACNILSARYFARQNTAQHYFAYDPGLMAGTGLARQQNAFMLAVWKHVLPILGKAMKGTSSPQQSAQLLSNVLLGQHALSSGDYVEYTGKLHAPFLPNYERQYSDVLMSWSDQWIERNAS